MKRLLLTWSVLGSLYVALETVWRGYSHPSMLIIGGLCGILVGAVNQNEKFYHMRIVCQSLLGAGIVLAVEFISGCVLNLWLGLGVWDYSGQPGNILGQICPAYGVLWFCVMPFAIWAEDTVQWLFWAWDSLLSRPREKPEILPYTLKSIYQDLVRGK